MTKPRFIDAVMERVDTTEEEVMKALSPNEKSLIKELMDEAAQQSLKLIATGGDCSKFTISRDQKRGVIEALKGKEFKDKPEKLKPASAYIDELAKEFQWIGRNGKLLKRLNDTIAEFRSLEESEE